MNEDNELFDQYDFCTEEGGVVVGLEGDNAFIVHPDTGAKPQKVPARDVVIAEVYSEEEIEPVELTLPAPLLEVIERLESSEEDAE